MKRLLLAFALLLFPLTLLAQAADRDVLLASDGTLYTIESTFDANGDSNRTLQLTIRQGANTTYTFVPESLNGGHNIRPTLAYDNATKTLFVFWIGQPNAMSSSLNFASYRDGQWQPAVTFDDQPYHFRYNLRIGITRHVSQLQKDGTYSDVPALLVHAVWWEASDLNTEQARYALLTIDNGSISSFEIHDLSEFAVAPDAPFNVDASFNPEILRHPAIIEGTDSVDVVFGDTVTHAINHVTLRPIADTRIHIPIGRGGKPLAPPKSFSAPWTGRISMATGTEGKLAFYNMSSNGVSYILFSDGDWSDVKTITTNSALTSDAAVAALNKMLVN